MPEKGRHSAEVLMCVGVKDSEFEGGLGGGGRVKWRGKEEAASSVG